MNVLAIDTSTKALSVAVLQDGRVLAEYTTHLKTTHSVQCMPAIAHLLKECGLSPQDLSRIAVAEGPGSYTGLRIGVTIAKSLAWSLGIPLVGVSSLDVLAMTGRGASGLIVPIIDARRGQAFTNVYRGFVDGKMDKLYEDQLMDCGELVAQLQSGNEPVLVIGADIPTHEETFVHGLGDRVTFAKEENRLPRAILLGLLGIKKEPCENIHQFVPKYARLAEAEVNWNARQGKAE